MKSKTRLGFAGVTLLTALGSSLALAEGVYVGASVGQARSDMDDQNKSKDVKVDKDSTGWKAFMGYQFTPYLGVEGFYADLGKSEAKAKTPVESGLESSSVQAKGVGAAGTLTWPVNEQFGVYGKGGFLYWNTSWDYKPKLEKKTDDEKGISPLFGLGASFAFNENFSVKVEWERYFKVGKEKGFDGMDIDLFSAGVEYRF